MPLPRGAKPNIAGFSLAEMAVVILLMGLVLTMGLKITSATLDNLAQSDTNAKLERIKQTLVAFMRSNGRLPCPDAVAGVPTGIEPAACVGAAGRGVLPWQTLGLPRDAVLDGWGNFIDYRVANLQIAAPTLAALPPLLPSANQNWTSRVTPDAFDITSLIAPAAAPRYQAFQVVNRTPGPGYTVEARNAVVVLLSHGKNGLGAKTTKVPARIAGAQNDEAVNAALANLTFVRRPATDDNAAPGGAFDDIVVYLTPQDLLQPLIDEKTLRGQCNAYCAVAAPGCAAANIPVGRANMVCP